MKHSPITAGAYKEKHKQKLLDIGMVIIWGIILLLNTWAESLEQLLNFKSIGFNWISHPNFWSFFDFYDITLIHHDFIIIKLGHFLGFGIMDLLIFRLVRKHNLSAAISILFAFSTEVLQLFFGRDGRLYDLMIDSLGILSVYLLLKRRN